MKAMIQDGVILNIVPDSYKTENIGLELKEIKKSEVEDLQLGNALDEFGKPKYILVKGVLKNR